VQPPAGELVVVLEASASVGEVLADPAALLAALPAAAPAVVFVAHGDGFRRLEGAIGSPGLAAAVRASPCTGGVDASAALAAAGAEAARRGVPRVLWLHGAAAELHGHPWPSLPAEVELAAFAVHPGRHALRARLPGTTKVVDVPRFGGEPAELAAALAEFVRFAAPGAATEIGDHERRHERVDGPPADAVPASDQLARLWAARQARAELRDGRAQQAAQLAARYRVVTAGAGAVVLESKAQYDAFQLDPGAPIGREPAGPIGGGPVPELSTWVMLATGLLAVGWWGRRRAAG
jgi:hypothetical protein